MRRFDNPQQPLQVAAGELFAIALAGNPSTGYSWQAQLDGRHLQLIAQEFQAASSAIGAGGWEVFRFQAGEAGVTEVLFDRRRPWSGEVCATTQVQVTID